jgi:hypothetical protein
VGIIKYGPLAQEVAGTVGGVTFARSYCNKTVRGWRAPVNKMRADQLAQRVLLQSVSAKWLSALSDGQRQGWDDYAATCPFQNSLGDYLNGFNLFVRNMLIVNRELPALLLIAPTGPGLPVVTSSSWTLEGLVPDLFLQDVASDTGVITHVIWAAHSVRPITKRFPYRLPLGHGILDVDANPPPQLLWSYSDFQGGAAPAGLWHALVTWYIIVVPEQISAVQTTLVTLTIT